LFITSNSGYFKKVKEPWAAWGVFFHMKHSEKNWVVYVEGTLYQSISLLEIGRGIMATPQGW
jgi:hypothetical protein